MTLGRALVCGLLLAFVAAGAVESGCATPSAGVDGDADTAADCVFWSTLLSAVTMTATMAVVLRVGA